MNTFLHTLAALAIAGAAAPAFAHAKLLASEPSNGATLTAAPADVKLHYNEPVEAAMSSIKLFGPGNTAMAAGKPARAEGDSKTLVVPLPVLPAGDYRLEWSTMGHDGHHMKGDVRFTIR
jgi:methionine-rich copper-binding protein CopC